VNRPTKPILTEWETQLLQILWDLGQGTASDIREVLWERGLRRSDSAIRKTLRVMEEKQAIRHTEKDRAFVYQPLIERNQAERNGIQYLSNMLFGGSVSTLALRALDEADLTPEVIAEIKKKLKEKKS